MLEIALRNWPLKAVSLVLAFAVWVAVTGERASLQDFSVPLDVALGDARTLASLPVSEITVRVRGRESQLRGIDAFSLRFPIDLTAAEVGTRTIELNAEMIEGLPRGIEVERIEPQRLSLAIDEKVQRQVKVVPTFDEQPPEGYHFYGAGVDPDSVLIEGPRRMVERLKAIGTDEIVLEEKTAPFTTRVSAVPESQRISLLSARAVDVRVEVDVVPEERRLTGVPVVVVGNGTSAGVVPETIAATVSGPPATLNRLRPELMRAVVDVTGLAPRPQPYHLLPRVEFVDVSPRDLPRLRILPGDEAKVSVRLDGP